MLQLQTTNEPEHKPWLRMEGEPTVWYTRYKRFQGLGPKRTMLAAVEQERASTKALKSTQKQKKPKPALVPGSWKAASIKWQWVERARAYDDDKVEKMVAVMFEDLYSGPALAYHRILELRNLSLAIQNDFNTHRQFLTADQRIAYYARLSAILRDIREEMKLFNPAAERVLLRYYATQEYVDYKAMATTETFTQIAEKIAPDTTLHQHGYATSEDIERLIKKLGGHEAAGKAIEVEQARRAALRERTGV
jgi:hypothetical protein